MDQDEGITVSVKFLTTEQGGKRGGIDSLDSYRASCILDEQYFDCRLFSDDQQNIDLGVEIKVTLRFLFPELAMKHIFAGQTFHLWEGRVTAHGKVLCIP